MNRPHNPHYFNNYKDSFVYKLFLKQKDNPECITTIDEAFDVIRMISELTGGMPQIVYLVGWQYDGHDSKYPAWHEVGRHCASSFSADPTVSLRTLMREAAKYHTKISLHINMLDAYRNSPLWEEYVANNLIARNADGSLNAGCDWGGETAYNISPVKELRAGQAQKRILELLELLPELRESGTIHIDAFMGKGSPGEKITVEDDLRAMERITDFWHGQGIDVTTEILTTFEHVGYFPMVFHLNLDEAGRLKYPPSVLCGGGSAWNSRRNVTFYNFDGWPIKFLCPSAGCFYEEAWGENYPADLTAEVLREKKAEFIGKFFQTSVVCRFLNRFSPLELRQSAAEYRVRFSGGVSSVVDPASRRRRIEQHGRTVADGGTIFADLLRNGETIMLMYSEEGFAGEVRLPEALARRESLRLSRFEFPGAETLRVADGKITLELSAGTAAVLE